MSEVPTLSRPTPTAHPPALRILLADDSQAFREATQELLRHMGHVVDAVADGRKALEAATREKYDLILMDIRMPIMDGLEATRLLREQVTGPRRLKIIAVTAEPPDGDDRWYVAAGMDGVLNKPFGFRRLAQVLDRAVAPKRGAPGPCAPVEVVVDGLLCDLQVWSESEWASLSESERPVACVFYEGLGWVGAVPKISLN
ncbi:MAG: response regulator [Isosphaeraceae bacterium]|nr:response regulator [Isosphaeraceae bacterium]